MKVPKKWIYRNLLVSCICIFMLGGCTHARVANTEPSPAQQTSAEDLARWAEIHKKVHSTGLIRFEQGSIQLSADAHDNLKRTVQSYFAYEKSMSTSIRGTAEKLMLISYTDKCGSAEEAMETSKKRALLVEKVLVAYGLPADAIKQIRWHGFDPLPMFHPAEEECQDPSRNMVSVHLFFEY